MKLPVSNTFGITEYIAVEQAVIEKARKLPYSHEKYFLYNTQAVCLKTPGLVLSRLRAKGVRNALNLMARASVGKHQRRSPIQARIWEEGTYVVIDGNSTSAIAILAGWPDIPAIVVDVRKC